MTKLTANEINNYNIVEALLAHDSASHALDYARKMDTNHLPGRPGKGDVRHLLELAAIAEMNRHRCTLDKLLGTSS